ncbi:MAG: glycosyltransferase [Gemmatimonadaceae bacterium]
MLVLQQTVIADYRQAVLELVAQRLGSQFAIYAGAHTADRSIATGVTLPSHLRRIRNVFIGKFAIWQIGALVRVVLARYVILELNPRIVNVWIALLLRRAIGRKSALWGHAWGRRGRGSGTTLRDAMCLLGGRIISYSATDASAFSARLPNAVVTVAPNALYRQIDIYANPHAAARNIVYVGRLIPSKKPDLLLEGFRRARERLPSGTRLSVVGDGPMKVQLRNWVEKVGLASHVDFLGHISNLPSLRELFALSLVSVSPGYVGLSLTQSHSFGVPMIYGKDEPHSPEIEAARDDFNAIPFGTSSAASLADVMERVFANRQAWIARRAAIAQLCADKYSVEAMADGLIQGAGYSHNKRESNF